MKNLVYAIMIAMTAVLSTMSPSQAFAQSTCADGSYYVGDGQCCPDGMYYLGNGTCSATPTGQPAPPAPTCNSAIGVGVGGVQSNCNIQTFGAGTCSNYSFNQNGTVVCSCCSP